MVSPLQADVYVSSRLEMAIERLGAIGAWSPITSTLIHGSHEAVLIDTPISIAQTEDLIRWIEGLISPQKTLKYIYITHGHGDHWFGIPVLRKRWPEVKILATKGTVAHMKTQLETPWRELWLGMFPGEQIWREQDYPEPMGGEGFELEGHVMRVVEVGHTDTHDTTVLHVPDLGLVVAGDAVYGDVHQYFGEANTTEKRKEWLRALDKIEALNPQTVIAGHKRAGTVDGVFNIQTTREYILAVEDATKTCANAEEMAKKIMTLYPNRVNPGAILAGAAAAFKGR